MTNIGTVASIITWHCHNDCTIHDKGKKLLLFSLKCHPFHPGIHKDPSIGVRFRAAYDILMAARVVAGIVS